MLKKKTFLIFLIATLMEPNNCNRDYQNLFNLITEMRFILTFAFFSYITFFLGSLDYYYYYYYYFIHSINFFFEKKRERRVKFSFLKHVKQAPHFIAIALILSIIIITLTTIIIIIITTPTTTLFIITKIYLI